MVSGVSSPTAIPDEARPTSSAEYIISRIGRHKLSVLIAVLVVTIGVVGLGLYLRARNSDVAIGSIAVLPFVNQNQDPGSDYLSDGITENVINSLSQLPNLRVMARTTVFRYKGRESDAQKAGKELGVEAVLTGNVLKQGDTLAIQADLVRVSDGSEIWGDKYTRKLLDIFSVQSDLAKEISDRLRLRLRGSDRERLAKHSTENAEAYELYLKGYHSLYKFTDEDTRKSIGYFEQAIAKDPNYAAAHAGLAEAYLDSVYLGNPEVASARAKQAAERALALDAALPDAHYAMALVSFQYDLDWPTAEREFQQALRLNPGYALAHDWYGYFLGMEGRFDEARAALKRGLEIDPLSLPINADLGTLYYWERRYDESLEQIRKTLELDPNFPPAVQTLAQTHAAQGRYSEALQEFERIKSGTSSFGIDGFFGYVYAKSGKKDEARRVLERAQNESTTNYTGPQTMALIYMALGDKDKAFENWQRICHGINVLEAIKVDPIFDTLRPDPRFADLVRCVGLTP